MATTRADVLTLSEQVKRIDPDGNGATIAEVLDEENSIVKDAPASPSNERYSHLTSVRTALPTPSARRINEGASSGVSRSKQVREYVFNLENIPWVDAEIVDGDPDPVKARWNELQPWLEAYAQEAARQFIYGNNNEDDTDINGLATRMDAAADDNVEDAGGSGSDCTSLYLVEWGPRCNVIYRKHKGQAAIYENDLGLNSINDPNDSTKTLLAYQNHIKLMLGLNITDNRNIQRLASIEDDGATYTLYDSTNNIMRYLEFMIGRLPKMGRGAVIYGNRTLLTQFNIWANEKTPGFTVTAEDPSGVPQTRYKGIPIHLVEQIVDTEAAL